MNLFFESLLMQSILWSYRFAQLKSSSDDGDSKLTLKFQTDPTKSLETQVVQNRLAKQAEILAKVEEIMYIDLEIQAFFVVLSGIRIELKNAKEVIFINISMLCFRKLLSICSEVKTVDSVLKSHCLSGD